MNNPFNTRSGAAQAPDLIPNGTLSHAIINIQAAKTSGTTGGTYYPVVLTLVGGEYEGRKVFDMLADWNDARNKQGWIDMAVRNVTRIFEVAGVFNPADENSYNRFVGASTEQVLQALDGQRCAIRIKVEKSSDPAFADKNKVGDFLSSCPTSGGYRDYVKLGGGQGAITQARSGAFSPPVAKPQALAQPQAPVFGQGPGWIKNPPSGNAPF